MIEQMARDAGFRKAGEISTASVNTDPTQVFGVDIVASPTMPEGFIALRTDEGAMVMGPKCSFWVPFGFPAAPET